MAVRNSLLEKFSGKSRLCWKNFLDFPAARNAVCQGLGTFRQGKWLLENRPRLWERSWIFSSETATAFLSSSDCHLSSVPLSAPPLRLWFVVPFAVFYQRTCSSQRLGKFFNGQSASVTSCDTPSATKLENG